MCAGNGVPMIGRAFTMMQQDNGEPGINVSQMSFSPGFLDMMGFRLLEGRIPERDDEVLVNETFGREMHFGDSVVGRKLLGGRLTVTGLLHDYAQWGFFAEIEPAIIKPIDSESAYTWFVKLSEPFDENYEKLNAFINETFPSEEWYVRKTDEVIERFYSELHSYRNASLLAAISLVLISLMGLIGFTRDEVERRRKEIAVRKVNGASTTGIIVLICRDLMKIAVPAVVVGIGAAWYVGPDMVEHYTIKASHLSILFILSGLAILVGVVVCVIVMSYRAANENPVTQLKSE